MKRRRRNTDEQPRSSAAAAAAVVKSIAITTTLAICACLAWPALHYAFTHALLLLSHSLSLFFSLLSQCIVQTILNSCHVFSVFDCDFTADCDCDYCELQLFAQLTPFPPSLSFSVSQINCITGTSKCCSLNWCLSLFVSLPLFELLRRRHLIDFNCALITQLDEINI